MAHRSMHDLLAPSLSIDWPNMPIERAEGTKVYGQDGRVYLDFVSGMAALPLGHNHPDVVAAIREQAGRLIHAPVGVYQYDVLLDLAEDLAAAMPGEIGMFFFGNSGSEAVEGSVKLARYVTGRQMVIGFRGGFHGRTLGALALTASKAKYRHGYQPLPGAVHGRFPYPLRDKLSPEGATERALQELDELLLHVVLPEDVAAFIVEPIQGEGGYVPATREFLQGLRERADKAGALLIYDEVQTGFGRTGEMFAAQHYGVTPDIMAVAKAIASGLPLGATASTPEIMRKWTPASHGTTFGGNPVAAAAARATLKVLREENLPQRAQRLGAEATTALKAMQVRHPEIAEVRGPGLMIGIEFGERRPEDGEFTKSVLQHCLDLGLVIYPCGTASSALRFIPPLNVGESDLSKGIEILDKAIAKVRGR
ncbi:MAG: aminotransferase class III-fold pyridoxal phosphate-dependent enzyme [Thermaerobacter sp.]|nr:aminotransferase class III-fold pyridoxal phosphate-dependent enzyme [Thermaerobacter sp.]